MTLIIKQNSWSWCITEGCCYDSQTPLSLLSCQTKIKTFHVVDNTVQQIHYMY